MKLVYIAGPYRADTKEGVAENIRKAQVIGLSLATNGHKLGVFPVIPHMNTAHFETHTLTVSQKFSAFIDPVPDEYWLQGTMALMEKCDAVLLTHPQAGITSKGTRAEVMRAIELGIPVYDHINGLLSDLRDESTPLRSINVLNDKREFLGSVDE